MKKRVEDRTEGKDKAEKRPESFLEDRNGPYYSGAFGALKEQLIYTLEKKKTDNDSFRIWVAGCSTGEEAYSVAILLRECMVQFDRHFDVQIFATDMPKRSWIRFGSRCWCWTAV